jgi:hypothetical protein
LAGQILWKVVARMLAIFGYLGAVAALFVAAAMGLMVLLGESAGLGSNLAAYADAKAAAPAKPLGFTTAGLGAGAAPNTTGQAATEKSAAKQVRPKPPKNRSAHADERKKRAAQLSRERR